MKLDYQKYGGLRANGRLKERQPGLPTVSIITIVRNGEAFLERTIRNVLSQSYPNIEYIVIDGNSTDKTLEIIKKYEDKIDVWVSEPDRGTHDAINKGTRLVTGDWVYILHCGDCLCNDEVLTDVFVKNKIVGDVVYGNFVGYMNEKDFGLYESDENVERLWQGMVFCHQAMFVKSSLAKKFEFDTKYKVSSDYDFVMKCYLDKAAFQKVNVVVTKIDTQGISNRHWLKAKFENWEIARRFRKDRRIDIYHLKWIVYDIIFRNFKNLFSYLGLYEPLRTAYRKTLKKKLGGSPNIKPLDP